MKFFHLFLSSLVVPIGLLFSSDVPIQTDYAIFLFDNGEKNMVASMLNYARQKDAATLDHLNFRIVFMGASTDALSKEPFCHYPDKMIHYEELGVEEVIDHSWKRDRELNQTSIKRLSEGLDIQKKVWVGVSCSIFEQLLRHYQDNTEVDVVALRDNPNPDGDTDYFLMADAIQSVANKVALPSKAAFTKLDPLHQKGVVVGHGPIEEWCDQAKSLDRGEIIERLGLNSQLPIIVYAGVYGDHYENCFKTFLELVPDEDLQILIVPHPRYKGIIEKKNCAYLKNRVAKFSIIGEFEEDPTKNAKTVEALCIADAIVTADATSTIVFQANALKKKVLYINPLSSQVGDRLCARKLLQKINNSEDFLSVTRTIRLEKGREKSASGEDIFELLGIPRNGAKLLWEEFLRNPNF
jgi:hypothetical protein